MDYDINKTFLENQPSANRGLVISSQNSSEALPTDMLDIDYTLTLEIEDKSS